MPRAPLLLILFGFLAVWLYTVARFEFWPIMGMTAAVFAFSIWYRVHYGYWPEDT